MISREFFDNADVGAVEHEYDLILMMRMTRECVHANIFYSAEDAFGQSPALDVRILLELPCLRHQLLNDAL